ncbi:hypothetical protein ACFWOI_44040, partial [Streptomyces sp. NPDC058424]
PCTSWNVLQLQDDRGTRLMSGLGELTPAHLTAGRPSSPHEASGAEALRARRAARCAASTEWMSVRLVGSAVRELGSAERSRAGPLRSPA